MLMRLWEGYLLNPKMSIISPLLKMAFDMKFNNDKGSMIIWSHNNTNGMGIADSKLFSKQVVVNWLPSPKGSHEQILHLIIPILIIYKCSCNCWELVDFWSFSWRSIEHKDHIPNNFVWRNSIFRFRLSRRNCLLHLRISKGTGSFYYTWQ